MWKMDSDQKSIPVVGFLTHNDCDVLRAKTDVYRRVTHRTIILPTLSNSIGRGGGLFSVWEGVWEGRFELGDMENGVDPSELLWEADCNGVHAQCKRANWALGLWNALHYSVSKGVILRK